MSRHTERVDAAKDAIDAVVKDFTAPDMQREISLQELQRIITDALRALGERRD